ncbi:ATP-binding protein [Thiohalophilus sp.]|uniref:ATP-binding protein n=1 Tax=Thiohalophilus sp. TaxID=3028392 RepID=UPI002ACE5DE3|nr:ATP-binding protein [Thiohalophilus sp.]MDZ7803618.1 ATP-binding protein [Thiohalophilus sp.]
MMVQVCQRMSCLRLCVLGHAVLLRIGQIDDLGRFGLGLKTASFSQCRRLTVLTRRNGITSCAAWDLDIVAETDEWYIEIPESTVGIPWADSLQQDGTLVVWQKLDRLVDPKNESDRKDLTRQINDTASHLELVFHRFLAGERGLKRVTMALNGRKLEAFDPFNSRHPATIFGPEDVFRLGEHEIRIQPVTLPHHKKVTAEEWDRYAGAEGYIKNQGFYLYREKRLIIHGTWFNLARQTELTKLARVRIDMPNGMDGEWKIDVKKASAQPPGPVRDRLRRIIEVIGAGSKRAYTTRGHRLVSENQLPVWIRFQDKNEISYGLNLYHPIFKNFTDTLSEGQKQEFSRLLSLIESTIPFDTFFSDISSHPKSVSTKSMEDEAFVSLVMETYLTLNSGKLASNEIRLMMSSAEPFRSNWEEVEKIIVKLEEGDEK